MCWKAQWEWEAYTLFGGFVELPLRYLKEELTVNTQGCEPRMSGLFSV